MAFHMGSVALQAAWWWVGDEVDVWDDMVLGGRRQQKGAASACGASLGRLVASRLVCRR